MSLVKCNFMSACTVDVFVTAEGDDGDYLHSILGMQPVLFLFLKLFIQALLVCEGCLTVTVVFL